MHVTRPARTAALALILIVALGACSSAPAAGTDPAGTVQAALTAVGSGGLTKLADFTCAAKKGDPMSALGASNVESLTAAGIKPEELMAAMAMTFANIAVTEKAKTATTATVHVTGDSTITLDKDKMRGIMKAVLVSQGKPADDATLDLVMNAMGSQLTQSQKIDEDITLVNEGGKWLLCE